MKKQPTPPSIKDTAFDCPYCDAFTTHTWYSTFASHVKGEPSIYYPEAKDRLESRLKDLDPEEYEQLTVWLRKMLAGGIVLSPRSDSQHISFSAGNLHLSECFHCKKVAIWLYESLVYPPARLGVSPNADLPDEIMADFEEARAIVNNSPRGAAALLRLVIQKLCVHLGEKGKNIDTDIASLVSKGLNPLVQKSLDIVRVIGNEAVHPGTLDLKDDRETALRLLILVNVIAEQMISHPKTVAAMYEQIPADKRSAIESRNEKARGAEK